ncbi:unnamed protein product, partial [Meganyctiphanes norvegica]
HCDATVPSVSPHFTDVGNLNNRDRQRLLGKAWSVPVVVHLMKGLQKYFQTEICTDSENRSNAFNCLENQTNNMEQIFVDSENAFPNTDSQQSEQLHAVSEAEIDGIYR